MNLILVVVSGMFSARSIAYLLIILQNNVPIPCLLISTLKRLL